MVGILSGSPSDLDTVMKAYDVLQTLTIPSEVKVLSAHRTPDRVVEYVSSAESRGIEVLVACAGMAAHLAGVVAGHTQLPVIGVPLAAGALSGLDSLLSTVQMPPGVPVATVGVDGAKNAAFLAARILSLKYPEIKVRLQEATAAQRFKYDEAEKEVDRRTGAWTGITKKKKTRRKKTR
jgi:5-(carboxyamino)imidazole ribonucleotide mutase